MAANPNLISSDISVNMATRGRFFIYGLALEKLKVKISIMRTICGCLLFLLFAAAVFAVPPLPDSQPLQIVQGEDLLVLWDAANQPRMLVWMQEHGLPNPFYPAEQERKIQLPRAGLGHLPQRLMIVPRDNRFKPKIVNVGAEFKRIKLEFESIPPAEVWFWGLTPSNPCREESSMHVVVRLIHQLTSTSFFRGPFVWYLKEESATYEPAFYFDPEIDGALESIQLEAFKPADQFAQIICQERLGGECPFAWQTQPKIWGRAHQVVFKVNKNFDPHRCPLY